MPPAGIVLTGGMSRRMGTDKATLVVDGMPMAERVVAVLAEAGVTTVAVAGAPELPDGVPGFQGPMAGIVSGWRDLQKRCTPAPDPVIVLSCDLPQLQARVVSDLVAAARNHRHGSIAHDGERLQPLIAAYRPVALDEIADAFEHGERSVRRCFGEWDYASVLFPAAQLVDADTPEDLAGHEVSWPQNS